MNVFDTQAQTKCKDGLPTWELGEGLKTSCRKKLAGYGKLHRTASFGKT